MDVVKLRKLARESSWDYGKYTGYKVKDVLLTNRKYLVWAYYNLEKISFVDDILAEFTENYTGFKIIDKPGKDPEYFKESFKRTYRQLSKMELHNLIIANKMNGRVSSAFLMDAYVIAKSKYEHANRNERITKASLQSSNQGKSNDLRTRKV